MKLQGVKTELDFIAKRTKFKLRYAISNRTYFNVKSIFPHTK